MNQVTNKYSRLYLKTELAVHVDHFLYYPFTIDYNYGHKWSMWFRAPVSTAARMIAPINQIFNDESIAVQIFGCLYVELFNGTHDKLVMARNL